MHLSRVLPITYKVCNYRSNVSAIRYITNDLLTIRTNAASYVKCHFCTNQTKKLIKPHEKRGTYLFDT